MKKTLKLFAIVCMIAATASLVVSCSSGTHTHKYGEWEIKEEATCMKQGVRIRNCTECEKMERESIPVAEHSFGKWTSDGTIQSRTCSVCDYVEYQKLNVDNSEENQENVTISAYQNFGMFLNDCLDRANNTVEYNGKNSSFDLDLSSSVSACSGYTILIPAKVTNVKFIGNTSGDPIQNLKIVIESRNTNIDVNFENILIESTETILVSETRNINVRSTFSGRTCGFWVIGSAMDGERGKDKSVKDTGTGEATSGSAGYDGAPAILVNSNYTIICSAYTLTIRGQDGGRGGDGGNVPTDNWLVYGSGGNGGNGGKGGDAVYSLNLASVEITIPSASVNIYGGNGGSGGNGGTCHGVNVTEGSDGKNGESGRSGCRDFIYKY